jgi:hypothetical protein
MGKVYEQIDDRLANFIRAQKVFFVATAPLAAEGHVNVSPKGFDALRILDPLTVAYLDLMGSGIETVAHLRENGRICLMFAAFEGAPKILRLYGRGEAIEAGAPEYARLAPLFPALDGARSIIRIRIERIADSCGWGVPLYEYRSDRDTYPKAVRAMSPEKAAHYAATYNVASIDGLPGLRGPTTA